MGKAFQCDRCVQFEEGEPIASVTFNLPAPSKDGTAKIRKSELCALCLASLKDWLEEPRSAALDAPRSVGEAIKRVGKR